jgi:hypothetical protein
MEYLAQVFTSGTTGVAGPQNFRELVKIFLDIINPLLVIIVALSLLVFFKGLVGFIAKSGDAKSHEDGKSLMIWGLIGLFVMISVWGILRMIYADFGFSRPFGIPLLPMNMGPN